MLGAHFGTIAAAEARLHDVAGGDGEVREYEITFLNALEIVDLGTWGFPSVLRELRSKGVLSVEQVDAAYAANIRSRCSIQKQNGLVRQSSSDGRPSIPLGRPSQRIGFVSSIGFTKPRARSSSWGKCCAT
ncbi:hypothetical protein J7E62_32470 [Variovorax paradoxus]|nr:hypothetical protein [Variovorax paradoxus]